MKIVIPFLYNNDTISISSHKLLLTTLKSYIFNKNTTPLIVAINNVETQKLLDKFITSENCNNIISYVFFDRNTVFNSMEKYKFYGHWHGNIARSKFFCVKNVAVDDDIIICDSDMLFVKQINFAKHILPNTDVQFFENYYSNSVYSGNIGVFLNRCAIEGKYNVHEFLNKLKAESLKPIDAKMSWPNGGFVYFSKKYRDTQFDSDLEKFENSLWFTIHLYEEEPFYLYMYHNRDNIKIEQNSSLNKRIYSWANKDIFDPLNIPNTDMLHYCLPSCKPCDFVFTQNEGYIIRKQPESIFDCMPDETIWNEFFYRSATTRILFVLWHYYYSFIYHYFNEVNDSIHNPTMLMNIMVKFKETNEKLKTIYTMDF